MTQNKSSPQRLYMQKIIVLIKVSDNTVHQVQLSITEEVNIRSMLIAPINTTVIPGIIIK